MAKKLTVKQVEKKFHEIVCQRMAIKDFNLYDEWGDDLSGDSLDLVETVMALEDEFGIEVPDDRAQLEPNFQVVELLNILKKELGLR